MIFDRAYRQRLETDLARWEADGVVAPAAVAAIRAALPPVSPGVNIAVVVAIVGGLLIASAFLAFIAAHWTEIARLSRLAILFAGIVVTHGIGAWFARTERPMLADLCASVGAIIFGAGIALVGQMYHLGSDFAGGLLLWAVGALVAAALTGSRGALAVALVAASIWSSMRVVEAQDAPHLPFLIIWFVAAGLALAWNSRVAAHLVALAVLPWWIAAAAMHTDHDAIFILGGGAALLFGGGLALTITPWQRLASAGTVLSVYGAFSLATVAVGGVATVNDSFFGSAPAAGPPLWAIGCSVAGALVAFAAGTAARRAGILAAGIGIALALVATGAWKQAPTGEPWLLYAAFLCAMVCIVVSGILDSSRPRIVAGWLGIAGVIGAITWAVKGSLLGRSVFLAVAGAIAVALALMLNRLLPRTQP
ncbi:DUF2157 domain-containing protein [Bradyrhizobium sp.]|uniref:DUF2157 domain-containing protein n=1 Tax=Bradyrhizobium sp. TaxID=376 RepID=UPI0025B8FF2A|nr:DUF2157 domain-containing protein [Bradyrhizobium sp.]